MTISEMLLPAFDQEMANTRAILDCVPGEKFSWKPHEKSVTMSRLASHIASGVKKQIHPLILHHFIPIPIKVQTRRRRLLSLSILRNDQRLRIFHPVPQLLPAGRSDRVINHPANGVVHPAPH
jgi:hypothetical protein